MFKNYLKITWAVLQRRKFFTFISLFGISFTLLILTLAVSFYDHLFSNKYPEYQRDNMLYIERTEISDSSGNGTNSSSVGRHFLHEYILKMQSPEKIAFASMPNTTNAYSPNKTKLRLYYRHTDANFWEVNNFEFVEGKPYNQSNITNGDIITVINENTRDDYFGKGVSAVGKYFEIDNINYKVIGVLKGSPITRLYTSADVYFPYHLKKGDQYDKEISGSYIVFLKGTTKEQLKSIKAEFASLVPKVPLPAGDKYFKPAKLYAQALPYIETFSKQLVGDRHSSNISMFYLILFTFMFLFMSLPAINLVNINMNRIAERSSEIGIRKAFGASSSTLTYQFIIENVLISILGSLIGIILSFVVIYLFNHSELIPYSDLTINWKVISWAIAISIVFGLLSGVYPAWRMSRINIVDALKAQ